MQMLRPEVVGQEGVEAGVAAVAGVVDQVDGHVGGKFHQYLAACATGGTAVVGGHSHSQNLPYPGRDHLEDGGALGTVGQAVGGVFNVDTGVYLAVAGQEGCTDGVMGVGGIGPLADGLGGLDQGGALVWGNGHGLICAGRLASRRRKDG